MKILFSLLLSSMLLLATTVFSQKALEKEWGKKLKELKPLDYKALIEERDNLQKEISECSSSKAAMRSESEGKLAEVDKLKEELEATKKELEIAKASTASMAAAPFNSSNNNAASPANVKGVQFKVQIGAFRNKDLTKYFQNNKNFSGEVDEDGTKKYTLGIFNEYWEADKFKKYLRDMGVKDAWIVSYKDGKRIDIKDALEGAL
ncbi:MAG: Ezrin/radixin/moesin family protein [Cytophagales bacterium]|nr:MAG: Ezrin/radixin/moesin family protein [Cytophagales bacterium]